MKKISEPVIFFGSGPVAAASLHLLVNDFTIEAVITKPRPVHHHGETPVLELAERLGLATFTTTDKRSLDELFKTALFKSRMAILVDFGIIVSQAVIDYFPFGIINSHFSLLPEWRGADPITFSILSGQAITGVSLMLLSAGMDEGPLLAQTTFDLPPGITTPELTRELIELSYQSLRQVLPLYLSGKARPAEQEKVTLATSTIPTYSRKLTKQDGVIDWKKPAVQIEREIRAFVEWPKSRTRLNELELTITKAHVASGNGIPGTFAIHDKALLVYTKENALGIDKLKPVGKKEMTSAAFLAGYRQRITPS